MMIVMKRRRFWLDWMIIAKMSNCQCNDTAIIIIRPLKIKQRCEDNEDLSQVAGKGFIRLRVRTTG